MVGRRNENENSPCQWSVVNCISVGVPALLTLVFANIYAFACSQISILYVCAKTLSIVNIFLWHFAWSCNANMIQLCSNCCKTAVHAN